MVLLKMVSLLAIVLVVWIASISAENIPCANRDGVCVCNETYCDRFDFIRPTVAGKFESVISSKDGKRLESGDGGQMKTPTLLGNLLSLCTLNINRAVKFQEMIGWGGAATGSVQYVFNQTTTPIQRQLLQSVFSPGGLDYNMVRTSIGGCDFDLQKYAFFENQPYSLILPKIDEADPNDPNWTRNTDHAFSLVYMLNRIFEVKPKSNIKLFGAVWSPPKWMKACAEWSGPSCTLKTEFYQIFADYHLRFLEFMTERGIDYYSISTGNEPTNGLTGLTDIMSLGWYPNAQGYWVKNYLKPTLKDSFPFVKILAGDDQRWEMPLYFGLMEIGAPGVMDDIDMFGVHWYVDGYLPAFLNDVAQSLYPNQTILNTESCAGAGTKPLEPRGPILGSWDRCQDYVSKYIRSFWHWNSGWIDWNLWLNEQGGPVNIDNNVDASIIVNVTKGTEFYKQPMYYGIGHFSKFISPGCRRIASPYSYILCTGIEAVAFECPDKTVTVVLQNPLPYSSKIKLADTQMNKFIDVEMDPESITTVVYAYA